MIHPKRGDHHRPVANRPAVYMKYSWLWVSCNLNPFSDFLDLRMRMRLSNFVTPYYIMLIAPTLRRSQVDCAIANTLIGAAWILLSLDDTFWCAFATQFTIDRSSDYPVFFSGRDKQLSIFKDLERMESHAHLTAISFGGPLPEMSCPSGDDLVRPPNDLFEESPIDSSVTFVTISIKRF